MPQYEWNHEDLTVERQREILEKRREYLLQLMPDDINANAGSTDSKLIEEWHALQLHRDKLLHSQIDKDNQRSLDSCYMSLLRILTTVGSYDHSATSQPMKQALSSLYWELKKYFRDVDIENTSLKIDTSLKLGTPTRPSPQKRKSKKTKLSRPDLIPSISVNQCPPSAHKTQTNRSPKRYKPSAHGASPAVQPPVRAPVVPPPEHAPSMGLRQSSSEWESTDESFFSVDVTDANTSACSNNTDTTINVTPVHMSDVEAVSVVEEDLEMPRTPLSSTPLNVSFENEAGLVTPKNAHIPNFGQTPVSTRTPLIRGAVYHTSSPSISKSKQRATPFKRAPYKVTKSASTHKRRKICRPEDIEVTATEQRAMGDGLSKEDLQAELQDEQTEVVYPEKQKTSRPLPEPHIVNAQDKAMAKALQKTFQNYKSGGVYTSPVKIDSASEKDKEFNISID